MSRSESRAGFEFSTEVKILARRRAHGACEDPAGCEHDNNRRVDHLTSIGIARIIGMERRTVKSLDNAQMLCDEHDKLKQIQERMIMKTLLQHGGNVPPIGINRVAYPTNQYEGALPRV